MRKQLLFGRVVLLYVQYAHMTPTMMTFAFQQTNVVIRRQNHSNFPTMSTLSLRCCRPLPSLPWLSSSSSASSSPLPLASTRLQMRGNSDTDSNIQKTVAEGSHMAEMVEKKSRFIGYAMHVENWDQAKSYIEEVKSEHPKARHWCVGFRCGTNPVQERCNDDGEPTGTGKFNFLGFGSSHMRCLRPMIFV